MSKNDSPGQAASMRDPRSITIALVVIAAAAVWWLAGDRDDAEQSQFDARRLVVTDLVGGLDIVIDDVDQLRVELLGPRRDVRAIEVDLEGDTLVIDQHRGWRFFRGFRGRRDPVLVVVRVPAGTPVRIDDQVGEVSIGDLGAGLELAGVISDARIGNVSEADISLTGGGRLSLGRVAGTLKLRVSGSAEARVASAAAADIGMSGSAELLLGEVAGGLDLTISGSGGASVATVDGEVAISISGSGEVEIAGGRADPLQVDVTGSGRFTFGGTAVNPDLSVSGSGEITIAVFEGELKSRGENIVVGN